MKKLVFVSSTFEDLQSHRSKVWDTLEEYDVNVRGMEGFGARTAKPLETCLAEVELSDVYVGIVAFRLGTVDKESRKSFTQLEYERAYRLYQLDKKKRMEILIYFADENSPGIPPSYVDFGKKREKLEVFKSILRDNHTVATFTDEDHLVERLKLDFGALLTRKQPERKGKTNEYKDSENKIRNFMLLPAVYSGKEIRLKLKLDGEPFSASKQVCNTFNLPYGATIGYRTELILPEIEEKFAEYVFVTENLTDTVLKIQNKNNVEVHAKLAFSETTIENFRARFITETIHYWSPHWSPLNVVMDPLSLPYDRPKAVTTPAEGSMILLITKVF